MTLSAHALPSGSARVAIPADGQSWRMLTASHDIRASGVAPQPCTSPAGANSCVWCAAPLLRPLEVQDHRTYNGFLPNRLSCSQKVRFAKTTTSKLAAGWRLDFPTQRPSSSPYISRFATILSIIIDLAHLMRLMSTGPATLSHALLLCCILLLITHVIPQPSAPSSSPDHIWCPPPLRRLGQWCSTRAACLRRMSAAPGRSQPPRRVSPSRVA